LDNCHQLKKQELWALLVKQIILYKEKIEVHFIDGSVSTFNRQKLMSGGDERASTLYMNQDQKYLDNFQND